MALVDQYDVIYNLMWYLPTAKSRCFGYERKNFSRTTMATIKPV
jgi:hypothetical protein